MRKIEEDRSLFYNLLDFARMSGGDKGGSVEDMFYGPGTELDAICHEYAEKNQRREWKVSGEIRIPSRSTFGKHRKQIRENPGSITGRVAGNYENILNALLWKNNYLPIENSRNESSREAKAEILRKNLRDVFEISRGFEGGDEELIFCLCEEKIVPYIQRISHIALFPSEMEMIRKTAKQPGEGSLAENGRRSNKVIALLLSIDDAERGLRLRRNIKNLESAFSQSMTEEALKIPVISCTAKEKNETKMVKNVFKNSSHVFLIADSVRKSEMDLLIEYASESVENTGLKPVVYINATGDSRAVSGVPCESTYEVQLREYSKESEILFDLSRIFLSWEIDRKPKAEMRSEVLLLNGIPAIDLSDHPMFSTNTLLALRKKYAQLNERYDCLVIENSGDTSSLTELDLQRGVIATRIRQCENIICDCQMSAIGIEQTGSILDSLNTEVESCVNSGKYEEAVSLLNRNDWSEEYNSALAHKAKADEVIRAYIKSRRYLIASMRVLGEENQTEQVADVYEGLRRSAKGTSEYEDIIFEYLAFLSDTGKYEEAQKLIGEEDSEHKKTGIEFRNYRFLYAAGEMYFNTGSSTAAEPFFRRASAYVSSDNRLDYIEVNMGIAKCLWKAKKYSLMRDTLTKTETFVSHEDMQSPRGRRIVSSLYRHMAIYESNCFNITKALKLANKALEIYTPLYETKQSDRIQETEDSLEYAAILNNIAVLYKRMENYDKAADYAREVLDIYRKCAKSNPAVSLTELTKGCRNYSMILRKQGLYDAAETVMSEALNISESFRYTSEKEKRQRISCLSEMGNIHLDLERYEKTEEYFGQVTIWLDKIKSGDAFMYDVYRAENCYDYGRLYRRMGEQDRSEEYLLEAADIWKDYAEESTGKYTILLAQAYAELALTVKKSRKKSAEYHRMSEELIERFGVSARKHARRKVEVALLP